MNHLESLNQPYLESSVYLLDLKRFLTITFTLIYFITSSGILFGQHLCMGRVNEAALFKKVEKKMRYAHEYGRLL